MKKFIKGLWDDMQPTTRKVFLCVVGVSVTAIVIALIMTGQLGVVLEIFK